MEYLHREELKGESAGDPGEDMVRTIRRIMAEEAEAEDRARAARDRARAEARAAGIPQPVRVTSAAPLAALPRLAPAGPSSSAQAESEGLSLLGAFFGRK